jgi:hypothetical protein
MYELTSGH